MRYGSDVQSVPLAGANASLAACEALCCATTGCVAFSFNFPQPSHTCVGGACCEEGAACCMLKDELALPLVNNTWPGAVQTGALPPAPGPVPPFARSADLGNASFGSVKFCPGDNGDTWPTAWLADDSLVGWDCDAHGSPMSLWRLDGDPRLGNLTPTLVSDLQALNYTLLCSFLGKTGSYPNINIKPGGMMALDGVLYAGVSCMDYGEDALFNRQRNLAGFVATSADGGGSWANGTAVGAFGGRFSAPVFVSCGRANDGDCLASGFVFAFFPGAFDDQAFWDNNDAHFLARVPPTQVLNRSAYQFFAGLDGAGAPLWTTDDSQAQPALEFGNMLGENAVAYHPFLRKYLIAQFGFIDLAGKPRPWHTKPFMSPHRTQLLFLEADAPWGPWRVFYASDDSPPAPGLYTPTFPAKFFAPVASDGSTTLVMFFSCLDGAENCRYTLNYVEVSLLDLRVSRAALGQRN